MLDLQPKRALIGHFAVAAELASQGLVPLPTIKNESGFDITAVNPANGKTANIQVRVQSVSSRWWSAKTSTIPHLVYFFVDVAKEGKVVTYYIVPQKEVEKRRTSDSGPEYYVRKEHIAPHEKRWQVLEDMLG